MYDFLYYLTLPFVIVSASMASFFILYPEKSKKQLMKMSWNATKFMVECNDVIEKIDDRVKALKFGTIDQNKSDFDSDSSDDNEYNEVIVYNHNLKRSFSCNAENFYEKTDIINNDNIKLILYHHMEDNVETYKRINRMKDIEILKEDEDDLEILSINKQFIQVEYIIEDDEGNEKIVDIHSNLGDFYVKGNIILDRYFLEWYLETFYDIEVAENYKLRFFDKDVNMFTLSTNNAIILCNNTYSKIDIDNTTFVIKKEQYEGAEESEDDEHVE
jgi:hypothetical protein